MSIITQPQPIAKQKEIVQFSSMKKNQILVVFKNIKGKGVFCSLPGLKNEDNSSPKLILKRKFLYHSLVKIGDLVGNFTDEKTSSTVYALKEPVDTYFIKKQPGVVDARYIDLHILLKEGTDHPLTQITKQALEVIRQKRTA